MNCTSRWTSGWTSRCGIHYGYGAFFPSQKGLQALRWTSRCSSRCPSRCNALWLSCLDFRLLKCLTAILGSYQRRVKELPLKFRCSPNYIETQKEQKWPKSDSKVTRGRPTPKWLKIDSKVTQDPILEPISSHFWVISSHSGMGPQESLLSHFFVSWVLSMS